MPIPARHDADDIQKVVGLTKLCGQERDQLRVLLIRAIRLEAVIDVILIDLTDLHTAIRVGPDCAVRVCRVPDLDDVEQELNVANGAPRNEADRVGDEVFAVDAAPLYGWHFMQPVVPW